MKKFLLVGLFLIAAGALAQVGNPVAQVAPSPSTISLQVWAKSWKEEDCGSHCGTSTEDTERHAEHDRYELVLGLHGSESTGECGHAREACRFACFVL